MAQTGLTEHGKSIYGKKKGGQQKKVGTGVNKPAPAGTGSTLMGGTVNWTPVPRTSNQPPAPVTPTPDRSINDYRRIYAGIKPGFAAGEAALQPLHDTYAGINPNYVAPTPIPGPFGGPYGSLGLTDTAPIVPMGGPAGINQESARIAQSFVEPVATSAPQPTMSTVAPSAVPDVGGGWVNPNRPNVAYGPVDANNPMTPVVTRNTAFGGKYNNASYNANNPMQALRGVDLNNVLAFSQSPAGQQVINLIRQLVGGR